MNLLEVTNLKLGYGNKVIINNLTFKVTKGEYIYVIGENGVGKSTLIKGLINLLKPISGSVKYHEMINENDIGYLPQLNTSMNNFPASVYEVVLSGKLNKIGLKPFYSEEIKNKANEVLTELNIIDLKNKSFRELSGGQQRRVLLARAMISSSEILIMDEPIAGLDPKATNEFYNLIYKLNKKNKLTIIVVSHDIKAAVKYADKVLHISENHFCFGDIESYKKNMLSELFLEEV